MEKVPLETQKQRPTRWILALTLLTLVQTLTFVGVTVITFLDTLELDQKEITLRQEIQDLDNGWGSADKQGIQDLDNTWGSADKQGIQDLDNGWGSADKQDDVHVDSTEATLKRIRRHIKTRLATRQSSLFVDMLKIQEQILEKHCRDRNKTCPPGPKGEQGPRGQQGTDGIQGPDGFDGQTGRQGAIGQPGAKGLTGDSGLKGDPGTAGSTGPSGSNGSLGEAGLKGFKGERGVTGIQGLRGNKGNIGDPGMTGTPGINKTQGQIGNSGDPGLKGSRGEAGIEGPKGNDSRKFADDCDCFGKPVFVVPGDSTVSASLHSTHVLPCNVTGYPPPSVTITRSAPPGGKRSLVSNGSITMISDVSNTDYGRYTCEARNQFGVVTKHIQLVAP